MPTESLFPKVEIPETDLWNFQFNRPDKAFPETHPLFFDTTTKRQITWADVRDQSRDFGIGLKSQWNWRKGDVLAIYSMNHVDFAPAIYGALWASGIVTTANPAYTVEELTFQLRDSGAKALITLPELLPVATEAAKAVGIPADRIVLFGEQRHPNHKHWREIRDPSTSVNWRRSKIAPATDVAFLVYSSGTTGHPKGVMLSHRNIVANVLQMVAGDFEYLHWQNDRIMGVLPFFHVYGLTCIVQAQLYAGRTTYVMQRFDLERFCAVVQEHKISYAYVVPPIVLLLAKNPIVENYDLSSLRMMNSGAAPLTKELVETLHARTGLKVKQGYGLSETSPVTHTQDWADWRSSIGSVGMMLPNLTAKYMSEDGQELPVGQTGELWLKGPNIMLGYLNNKKATENCLTEDGYFKTGDVGHQDAKGHFYITDRVKELIKYKGFQVPPAELEGLLSACELVDDVAVTGVYMDALASEVPRAYVVAKKGVERGRQTENEICEYVAKRVAGHKKLRGGVVFIDVVPKSASGKILRRLLKVRAKEEEEGSKKSKARL